jgi:hypothetical protein
MSYQTWQELVSVAVADGTAIASSTTETLIFTAPTLDANYLTFGRTLRLQAYGKISNTSTPTIRFRLRYGTATGGVVLADTGAITMAAITGNSIWAVLLSMTVRSVGATGTIMCMGNAHLPITSSSARPTDIMMGSAGETTPATATIDTTVATALSLTALWGTNSASNTLTGTNFTLEALN